MSDGQGPLPPHWEVRQSTSFNLPYYYNTRTKESRWERPQSEGQQVEQVRASHLLVKHRESRRPASWRSSRITRSKEEAEAIIREYRARIVSGEITLAALATTESDCSSATRGGDLGFFTRGQMQPAFENAAFDLEVGAMSDLVWSDSGVHLILRTA
ncbi:peptidyl-prolyl cis-trans isomerase pin1 [Syncephalis plumigaleata]|nr:peptidyl-prolyl cis-trans isomerase pin1 [Syncephalis plumigaleata]